MVTLVDSSVWIDFLRDRDTAETNRLTRLLTTKKIVTGDLVLMEVLQGIHDNRTYARTLQLLLLPGVMIISDVSIARQASNFYRTLRAQGITIRKTIDTLIATRCILDDIPLLYSDRDFDPFVAHLGLRSAMDIDTGVN